MSDTDYYLFRDLTQKVCTRVHSAVDTNGRPVSLLGGDAVRPWDVTEGSVTLVDYARKGLSDRLWSYSRQLVLSAKAHEVIRKLEVPGDIVVVPVSVLTREKQSIARYYVYYSRSEHDVLDREKAVFEKMRFADLILHVTKWAIDRKRILAGDIFHAGYHEWIVSEKFVRAFQENAIGGCGFIPVAVS